VGGEGGGGLLGRKSYPAGADAPTKKQVAVETCGGPQHSASIRRLKFAPDASRLATASADNTVGVLRTPLKRLAAEGTYLTGHTGAVNSVAWTRDASMLVSASVDRTARVWSPLKSTAEALVVIDRRGRGGTTIDEKNGLLNDEVKHAQFYYMDRFLCLVIGGRMLLYEIKLANDACDDLERLRKKNHFREVACFQSRAERISAMTCVNGFLSHILLAACSNRSVEVWDAATNQLIHAIPEAHERVAHALVINEASSFVSHPSESYDLFLSCATDGVVALWDLRSCGRVCRFQGHSCRVHPVGVELSPCLRFVAVGSEDRCAYLFDVRMGSGLLCV